MCVSSRGYDNRFHKDPPVDEEVFSLVSNRPPPSLRPIPRNHKHAPRGREGKRRTLSKARGRHNNATYRKTVLKTTGVYPKLAIS